MSEIKTYSAPTMQDALNLVRAELGTDAVILHTRQQSIRRWLPWQKKQQEVEITATANKTATGQRQKTAQNAITKTYAKAKPAISINRPTTSKTLPETKTFGELIRNNQNGVELALSSMAGSAAKNSRLSQPTQQPRQKQASTGGQNLAASVSEMLAESQQNLPANAEPNSTELAQKLDRIQQMIERLDQIQSNPVSRNIPEELFGIYTQLIDAEVDAQVAQDVIFELKTQAEPKQLTHPAARHAMTRAWLEKQFKCSPPIQPKPGQRKVISLIGPTGVGKTTTIAKLAANFRIRDGIRMGLVTVDTYRIAAVEQLRTYAEIIDLPMKVVTNPLEMRRALDEMMGLDLVLIDTAGRSPRDDLKIKELKSLLSEADVDEVHLVLSLTAGLRNLMTTAEQFAEVNTSALILTKLDEAIGPGALLNVARSINLPVSYITTGQDVPNDIEISNPQRLANFILDTNVNV